MFQFDIERALSKFARIRELKIVLKYEFEIVYAGFSLQYVSLKYDILTKNTNKFVSLLRTFLSTELYTFC